jgi:hypothetical protein
MRLGSVETLTGLLVLTGFLQVIVLLMQWSLINRQDKHFRTSERAWILAQLGWYSDRPHEVAVSTKKGGLTEDLTEECTQLNVKLTCRNAGKSPAWIRNVYGYVEITARRSSLRVPGKGDLVDFGPMEPLGAGKERSRVLELKCGSQRKADEFLSLFVIVEYRDIFDKKRETFLGYTMDSTGIYRQTALADRNRNT